MSGGGTPGMLGAAGGCLPHHLEQGGQALLPGAVFPHRWQVAALGDPARHLFRFAEHPVPAVGMLGHAGAVGDTAGGA